MPWDKVCATPFGYPWFVLVRSSVVSTFTNCSCWIIHKWLEVLCIRLLIVKYNIRLNDGKDTKVEVEAAILFLSSSLISVAARIAIFGKIQLNLGQIQSWPFVCKIVITIPVATTTSEKAFVFLDTCASWTDFRAILEYKVSPKMFVATKQKKNKATKRYSLLGLKDSPSHNFCKIESESAKKVLEETKNIRNTQFPWNCNL